MNKSKMKYSAEIWKDRHRHRTDISTYLTHLTRGQQGKYHGLDSLKMILEEKKLRGSRTDQGFIIGNSSAVCFQDIPIYGVAQNLLHEQLNRDELGSKIRYNPIGLCFDKKYVFKKGGRPVLYEKKDKAKSILPPDEWWRIVSFDLSNDEEIIDWTHEREWRVKGDFEFDLGEALVLFPSRRHYKRLLDGLGDIINNIGGIICLEPILS